jgi:hypothetical protein
MVGPDGSRHVIARDPATADGCPQGTATRASRSSGDSRKQPAAAGAVGGSHSNSSKQSPGRPVTTGSPSDQPATAKVYATGVHAPQQQQQQQEEEEDTQEQTILDGSGSSNGRRLLWVAAAAAAAQESPGDERPARAAAGSSKGSSGSSPALEQAIAASRTKSRAACWRVVYSWPFGEEGRVWGFNKAGDGLYITSSVGG